MVSAPTSRLSAILSGANLCYAYRAEKCDTPILTVDVRTARVEAFRHPILSPAFTTRFMGVFSRGGAPTWPSILMVHECLSVRGSGAVVIRDWELAAAIEGIIETILLRHPIPGLEITYKHMRAARSQLPHDAAAYEDGCQYDAT
ncbi:uncharacterized protein BT62DRAFT_1011968 [Guyanagaster necrorhizus]|uniref:Uncharacterized protein n=1 Tax=Guyanagaster necrorhizus TaxID=856835 RepID=A0A9P7VI67_9AGAR|nr:uncharacterized protein BT62DRAFT_1011968 [Guyanagaster necrorhizus MCA 3950]KAG7441159.1 hypothetical protein BT62DRAFT_1011968 [Guyanagaster necrorhizus MCA 3950]